jgi:hypothetical protein
MLASERILKLRWNSVADYTLERMLGHKAVAAGIAGPEIADNVVSQIG